MKHMIPCVLLDALLTRNSPPLILAPRFVPYFASKSFAWSPDPAYDDLAAVGLLTGRTILLRITETPFYTSNASANSIIHLNVRHPRPCNVVAFSPEEPNLIVTGYDKVRDNSLLIWDIKGSVFGQTRTSPDGESPSSPNDYLIGNNALRNKSPASSVVAGGAGISSNNNTASPASDLKPIAQFGLSEQVSAATFLHSPRTLVAAMALKWIRCYDLRASPASNSSATAVMTARNISSLVADPFDAHRFASVSEDGIVRMWDLRHNSEPILTFSSEDGVAKGTDKRSLARQASKLSLTPSTSTITGGAGPTTISVAFSPTRRGHIATLDRDANYLSAWNIFEVGANSKQQRSIPALVEQASQTESAQMAGASSQEDGSASFPTLYYERRSELISICRNSNCHFTGFIG